MKSLVVQYALTVLYVYAAVWLFLKAWNDTPTRFEDVDELAAKRRANEQERARRREGAS